MKKIRPETITFVEDFVQRYGLHEIWARYDEPWRFYHNKEHVYHIFQLHSDKYGCWPDLNLSLLIVFHDAIYDPQSQENEQRSANLLRDHLLEYHCGVYDEMTIEEINELCNAIVLTQYASRNMNFTPEFNRLMELDLSIIHEGTPEQLIQFEHQIFKEYQFVDYEIYKSARIQILKKLSASPFLIDYVEHRQPNIAIYPGSFNPFHIGHLDILKQAEAIFDKVIIGRGINPNKTASEVFGLPSALQYYQVDEFDGLLTDYIKTKSYPVTVIKGLRNANDFNNELTQFYYLNKIDPNIKLVSLFSKQEHSHVSSSGIKQLESISPSEANKYLTIQHPNTQESK